MKKARELPVSKPVLIIAVALVLLAGAGIYLYFSPTDATDALPMIAENDRLTSELASTTARLQEMEAAASSSAAEILALQTQVLELEDDLRKEKRKNDDFEDQIDEIAGTVGVLDKLAKTDEELLQKYSKVYFLNENYIPARLSKIPGEYVLSGRSEQYFHAEALSYLEDMLDEAKEDGVDLKVVSAYRSFETQMGLKSAYTQAYGSGANAFSADQGYSEHQLGTTVDLTDPGTGGTYESFKNTAAYAWLQDNAHKFGFVLSYPEGNQYYIFEPWHWRFVGEKLAKDLKKDSANFYDWDQRDIDEYLVYIFD